MTRLCTDAEAFSQWPIADRVAALKALLPRELLERALARSARPTRYCRRLPGWFLLWFVVGIGLLARDSYQQVYTWLTPFRGRTPPRSTFGMARRRLGLAPPRWLAEHVAARLATPDTPGAFHRGYRLMGIDGFVLDTPDHPTLDRAFGRPRSGRGVGAFPQVRVRSVCELGTHLLWESQLKPMRRGEPTAVAALVSHPSADMLLIRDRGFFRYRLIRQVVVGQNAQWLARVTTNPVFRTARRLADGSYLSKVYASANDRRAGHRVHPE